MYYIYINVLLNMVMCNVIFHQGKVNMIKKEIFVFCFFFKDKGMTFSENFLDSFLNYYEFCMSSTQRLLNLY